MVPSVQRKPIDVLHGQSPAIQSLDVTRKAGQARHTPEHSQLVAQQNGGNAESHQRRAGRVILHDDRGLPVAQNQQHIGIAESPSIEDSDPRSGEVLAPQLTTQRAISASTPRPTASAVPTSWLSEKRAEFQLVCSLRSAANGT